MKTGINKQQRNSVLVVIVGLVLALLTLGFTTGATLTFIEPPVVQEPSRTAPPDQLQLPTATPTEVGGSTATPTRTPTQVPVMAEVIGDPTNLRSLPTIGDEYVIDTLSPGVTLPIIGRWLGYDWLLVAWEDGPEGQAWVYAPLVIVRGDITTVPAVEPPPPPTLDPTQAAIQATAAVLIQTPGAAEAATATALYALSGSVSPTPDPGQVADGVLPTFTPPSPYVQPEELPSPEITNGDRSGIPPAVIIISLVAMGGVLLLLGLLRRIF